MAGDIGRALRRLEEARDFAGSYRFEMTAEYRSLIERVEAVPDNRPAATRVPCGRRCAATSSRSRASGA
jgi:hypothetical protein